MLSGFKLHTWYRFKSELHRDNFLNAHPSYGRFASIVELCPFRFNRFIGNRKHFKHNFLVDLFEFEGKNDTTEETIMSVESQMKNYIEEA